MALGLFPTADDAIHAVCHRLRHKTPFVIAVIDCETTGLGSEDEVWEVAVILRYEDLGPEHDVMLHLFVDHDRMRAADLPQSFRDDHDARYDPREAVSREEAAKRILAFLTEPGRPVYLLGAVPSFDERMLGRLFGDSCPFPWNYHLQDIESYARGWLRSRGVPVPMTVSSDDLTALTAFKNHDADGQPLHIRHTACDDARWALDWYDHLTTMGRG